MKPSAKPLRSAIALIIFSFTSFAGTPDKAPLARDEAGAWSTTLLGAGFMTNDQYNAGNIFLNVPLWSTIGEGGTLGGDYLFLEPSSSIGDGGEVAGSLGLSYRHLFSRESTSALDRTGTTTFMQEGWFVGSSFFVDVLDTWNHNSFWQLGVGAEIGNRYLELRGNYYVPLSGESLVDRRTSTRRFSSMSRSQSGGGGVSSVGDPFAAGNQILQDVSSGGSVTTTRRTTTVRTITELFEQGMEGWDAELAVLVPWVDQWLDLRVIGGYLSFDGEPIAPEESRTGNVRGWKAGVEVRPVPALVLSGTWFEDERFTGSNWLVGMQLQVPLDKSWRNAFKMRRRHLVEHLAEPVHRQSHAVRVGNRLKEKTTTETSVTRVTKVTGQGGPQRVTLADDVVFANNGPAVGNGIQAGSAAGNGTAENPTETVQAAATIAGANATAGGRTWNVYTQGGSNKFGEADYFENVTASGSTNFIGNAKLIPGRGGKNFGTGNLPVVAGTITSTALAFLGVEAYFISGVVATNVGKVIVKGNQTLPAFGEASPDTIHLITSGSNAMEATIAGNTISGSAGRGIRIEGSDTSLLTASLTGNQLSDINDVGIEVNSKGDATLNLTVSGNTIKNALFDGMYFSSDGTTSRLNATVKGNMVTDGEGPGIGFRSRGTSLLNLAIHDNSVARQAGEGIGGGASDNSNQNLRISNNTFSDLGSAGVAVVVSGTADSSLSGFDGNSIAHYGANGRENPATGLSFSNVGQPGASMSILGTQNNLIGPAEPTSHRIDFSNFGGDPTVNFFFNGIHLTSPINQP